MQPFSPPLGWPAEEPAATAAQPRPSCAPASEHPTSEHPASDHPEIDAIATRCVYDIVAVLPDLSDSQRSTIEAAAMDAAKRAFALGAPTLRFEEIIPRPTVRLPSVRAVKMFSHETTMSFRAGETDTRSLLWGPHDFYFADGSWVSHRELPDRMKNEP